MHGWRSSRRTPAYCAPTPSLGGKLAFVKARQSVPSAHCQKRLGGPKSPGLSYTNRGPLRDPLWIEISPSALASFDVLVCGQGKISMTTLPPGSVEAPGCQAQRSGQEQSERARDLSLEASVFKSGNESGSEKALKNKYNITALR